MWLFTISPRANNGHLILASANMNWYCSVAIQNYSSHSQSAVSCKQILKTNFATNLLLFLHYIHHCNAMTGHIQSQASSQSRVQSNIEGWSHLKKSKERAAPSPALGTSPRRLSRSRVRSLGAIGHRAPSSATMLARGKLRGQGWHITRVAPPFCQSLGTQFPFRNHPFPSFLRVLPAWQVENAQGQG